VIRFIKDALSNAASKIGFPWNTPSPNLTSSSSTTLFQESISDADREHFYRRSIGKRIVDKIVDDAIKAGFVIDKRGTPENPDKKLTEKAYAIFSKHSEIFAKAWKLARLYGYSFILLGFKDGRSLATPASAGKLEYTLAIPKTWIDTIEESDTLPSEIKYIEITTSAGEQKRIHASRLIYIENADLIPPSQGSTERGRSVLDAPFDLLTVLEHHNWCSGQAMWRYGAGLLAITVPEGDDPQDALDAIGDPCAKTVIAFPDGYDYNFLGAQSKALNPKPYFEQIITQLSGLTEYPKSILWGLSTGAVTGSELDRLNYADSVESLQNHMTQSLRQLLIAGGMPQGDWEIRWNSPLLVSDTEKLEQEKLRAEVDKLKIESGVRTPDEIRERDGLRRSKHDHARRST